MKVTVRTAFNVAGMHHWPEAPDVVGYLRSPHRHVFRYVVEAREHAADDAREVEFHMLQRAAKTAVVAGYHRLGDPPFELDFGARSCETLARELARWLLAERWPVAAVEVWEDEDNGARVELEALAVPDPPGTRAATP